LETLHIQKGKIHNQKLNRKYVTAVLRHKAAY